MEIMQKVAVIIISYRTSHLMAELVNSINEPGLQPEIYILDNGATESTSRELNSLTDSRVRVFSSEKNLGFTGGINFLVQRAKEYSPELRYFFLLNPDAISVKGLIGGLLKTLMSIPDAAGISPEIVHMDGRPWYSGALMNDAKGVVVNTPARSKAGDRILEVDVFSGCACLFDLEKVAIAGMFNESLFMYYDEADLSIRLRKRGFKIYYDPNWKVLHDVSYTTRNISHLKAYYMTRNKLIVFGESMSALHKVQYVAFQMLFYLKHGMFKNAVYHIRGLVDYKKGKSGALAPAS